MGFMKKILVISDSHGDYYKMQDIINERYDVDYRFHLGDYAIPDYLMSDFLAVKGNQDVHSSFPSFKDVEIEGFKIHLEHGNNYRLAFELENYLKEIGCDIFLFGHTHQKMVRKINNTILLNPGSLTRPRDGDKGSYLIITLEKDKEIKYEFIEV